ncbi:MAG: heavy-metal-associated domain-containing protein [Anaerolineae bacterium]
MSKVVLNVPDISCQHCAKTVTEALTPIEGVRTVQVDVPAKQIKVEYDETVVNLDAMKVALQEEDYPVASAVPA